MLTQAEIDRRVADAPKGHKASLRRSLTLMLALQEAGVSAKARNMDPRVQGAIIDAEQRQTAAEQKRLNDAQMIPGAVKVRHFAHHPLMDGERAKVIVFPDVPARDEGFAVRHRTKMAKRQKVSAYAGSRLQSNGGITTMPVAQSKDLTLPQQTVALLTDENASPQEARDLILQWKDLGIHALKCEDWATIKSADRHIKLISAKFDIPTESRPPRRNPSRKDRDRLVEIRPGKRRLVLA